MVKSKMVLDNPECYLAASACAALVNFPLWKASAMAQSGFAVTAADGRPLTRMQSFVAGIRPPYRGAPAVLAGMTWARAAIFYGSDAGKGLLLDAGAPTPVAYALPPMLISTTVQLVNMPLVRASVSMQNPAFAHDPHMRTTTAAIRHIYATRGLTGLWHGTSAGILKTVPKYVTSVVVKDMLEQSLPPPTDPDSRSQVVARSAVKSVIAGLAGAVLTNPMDVLRNEMFKTDLPLLTCARNLYAERGLSFLGRGIVKNLTAVSVPIATAIFLTDVFVRVKADW